MNNLDKKRWLLHEIEVAQFNSPETEYITFNCPWGARYQVLWNIDRLKKFQNAVKRCTGFKIHRGGPNRHGIK